MWEPFRVSIEWAPQCRIVYDKFHIIQHANDAVDEVRRSRVLPQRAEDARSSSKGKSGCLLSPLEEPGSKNQRGLLNQVFHLNRRVFQEAYTC